MGGIALTNARVLDGNGGAVQDDVTILIERGSHRRAGAFGRTRIHRRARVVWTSPAGW